MNPRQFLVRSLIYYRKAHLWVVLGTMISTAILVGALVIGDSVRYSLRKIVSGRLGKTEFALTSADRFFRTQMADDLADVLKTPVVPLLQTKGIAIAGEGQNRVNKIQVLGVDARFGQAEGFGNLYGGMAPGEVIVNRPLADLLGLEKKDEILLRMQKLDAFPKDAPLSLDSDLTVARRFAVKDIASDSALGRFNLRADQIAPHTVFIRLDLISREMDIPGRANVLLVAERTGNALDIQELDEAVEQVWSLADAGFELSDLLGKDVVELRSNRIFLDPFVADVSLELHEEAQPVLTYFVNEIRLGGVGSPYAFVAAPGAPIVPPDMGQDEVIINTWLADDIEARVGDRIRMAYFVMGPGRELEERTSEFRVRSIVPIDGIYADPTLLPDFPGLSGAEDCRDWDPGIPLDLAKIRDKDEDYWDDFRGTPKAFVTLNAAQDMWVNRFGNLTAIRFPGLARNDVANSLKKAMDPAAFGFVFRPVKKEGTLASSQSVDFSQLFLGLSFFIVVAALLLTSLLFVFNTENRSEENGLLLALGFPEKKVKSLVLREGAVLVAAGSLLGGLTGILYNGIILNALKTVWRGAIGTSALQVHVGLPSLALGISMGAAVAFFTIWLAARKQIRQSVAALQRGLAKIDVMRNKKPRLSFMLGIACLTADVAILFAADFGRGSRAFGFFFAAGSLFLIGGVAFSRILLYRAGKRSGKVRLRVLDIGIRNNARNRTRSLTLIGILACALFIVFTVGANRLNARKDAERRDSGTGGFALYGESTIPVLHDLDTEEGKKSYGLDIETAERARFVQFRVREGDDASCLNLNRVPTPQLIGVLPEELAKRRAFTFAEMTEDVDPENPWMVLAKDLPDGLIPAVADRTVIVWGLGKAVGDSLAFSDEKGNTYHCKLVGGLANSVFQGNIIISEKNFIQKYPSSSGYTLFLIDAPPDSIAEISANLSWALQDLGLDMIPASVRLEEFNTVQNTYLSIFLILGSFGLLLGSAGLGIILWRNVRERRGELALLRAVGTSQKTVRSILLVEHVALLAGGILLGLVAALLASLPSLLTPGTEIPYPTILIILIAVSLNGWLWTSWAAAMATREDLIPALRRE